MNAHGTAIAIGKALEAAGKAALAGVHFYAHDTEILPGGDTQNPVAELMLPAVFIRVTFQGLTGSATIGRAKIELSIVSQSDDETSTTHSSRETAVREVMADVAALLAAFDGSGVELLGKPALIENDPDTEDRAFKTPLTYRAGVREL